MVVTVVNVIISGVVNGLAKILDFQLIRAFPVSSLSDLSFFTCPRMLYFSHSII